jgi:hypothetical protein
MDGRLNITADVEDIYYEFTVPGIGETFTHSFPRKWASSTGWNGFCRFIPGTRAGCEGFHAHCHEDTLHFVFHNMNDLHVIVQITDKMRQTMLRLGYRNL